MLQFVRYLLRFNLASVNIPEIFYGVHGFTGKTVRRVCNIPGVITAHPGLLSYVVSVAPNTVWRRYIDHLKETAVTPNINKEQRAPQLDPALLEGIS